MQFAETNHNVFRLVFGCRLFWPWQEGFAVAAIEAASQRRVFEGVRHAECLVGIKGCPASSGYQPLSYMSHGTVHDLPLNFLDMRISPYIRGGVPRTFPFLFFSCGNHRDYGIYVWTPP